MDNFFTSGLTMGHPALVPVTAIYGTPEDCANEVAYIYKRGYPVVGIEIGEECDGKHTMPEDYAAHLLPSGRTRFTNWFLRRNWADRFLKAWIKTSRSGRTIRDELRGWTRFVDYLKAHGHLKDLAFMSFEHYPFMINGNSPPCEWDTLYLEPGIMKHVLHMWREDGVPADVPLIISESGITAGAKQKGLHGRDGKRHLGMRRVRHIL